MFVCYNHTLLLTVTKTLLTLVKASQTKQIEGQNLTVLSILQQSGGPYIIHIILLLLYRYSLYLATILLHRIALLDFNLIPVSLDTGKYETTMSCR